MAAHSSFLAVLCVLVALCCVHFASATCNLPCVTHGIPNGNCTSCQCLGAWTGTDCSVWDDNVDAKVVVSQINDLLNKYCPPASSTVQKKRSSNPILDTALGRGIDLSTGALKMSQLIVTDYSGGNTWTNSNGKTFTRRAGTTFQTFGSNAEETFSEVYTSLYDYANDAFGEANLNEFYWEGPALAQETVAMMEEIFPNGAWITVAKQTWPLFSEEFPSTPPGEQFAAFTVLKGLPPDYSTDRRKTIWRNTLKSTGTHVIVGATYGGVMGEVSAVSETLFVDYGTSAKSIVELWAENELGTRTGKVTASGSYFGDVRSLTSAWSAPPSGSVTNPSYDTVFQTNMQNIPTPFKFKLLDYTTFLPQPLQTTVRTAINEYLQEQFAQIESLNQCPSCVQGTCDSATKTCVCDSPTIVGSACNQCASGWTGSRCDIATCSCTNGWCSAPNECNCYEGWAGATCDQQITLYSCDYYNDCTTGVCCTSMCQFVPENMMQTCRYSKGACDAIESCSGYLDTCGTDQYITDTTEPCAQPSGPCGTPSYCTGDGPFCKAIDVTSKLGQTCRANAGPCDAPETCAGDSQLCPLNKFMAQGTTCKDTSGASGVCTGLSPNCVPFCNVAKLIMWQDPIAVGSASIPATLLWFLADGTTYTITVVVRIAGNADGVVGTFKKENVVSDKILHSEAITIPITSTLTQGGSYEYIVTVTEGETVRSTKTILATAGATAEVKADSQQDFITCPAALNDGGKIALSASTFLFALGVVALL